MKTKSVIASIPKWRNTGANSAILDVLLYGYKLPLMENPNKSAMRNNASARSNADFVGLEIEKLLFRNKYKQILLNLGFS